MSNNAVVVQVNIDNVKLNRKNDSRFSGHLIHKKNNFITTKDVDICVGDFVYLYEGEISPVYILTLDTPIHKPTVGLTEKNIYFPIQSVLPELLNQKEFKTHEEKLKYLTNIKGKIDYKIGEIRKIRGIFTIENDKEKKQRKITFSGIHVISPGIKIISKWIIGIVIRKEFLNKIYKPIKYYPKTLSNNEILNINTKGIMIAMMSLKLFKQKTDYIIDGKINDEYLYFIPDSDLTLRKVNLSFSSESYRIYIIALILCFPYRRLYLIEKALSAHCIGILTNVKGEFLLPHLKYHLYILLTYKNKQISNIQFLQGKNCEILYNYKIDSTCEKKQSKIYFNLKNVNHPTEMIQIHSFLEHSVIALKWKVLQLVNDQIIHVRAGEGYLRRSYFSFDLNPCNSKLKLILFGSHLTTMEIQNLSKCFRKNITVYHEDLISPLHWLFNLDTILLVSKNYENLPVILQSSLGGNPIMSIEDNKTEYNCFSSLSLRFCVKMKKKNDSNSSNIYNLNDLYQLKKLPYSNTYQEYTMDISGLNLKCISNYCLEMLESGSFKSLDFSKNRIQYLPSKLATIKSLQKVFIDENPFDCIPFFYTSSWKKMKEYLLSIHNSSESWNRSRIIIVGQEGVGKVCFFFSFLFF